MLSLSHFTEMILRLRIAHHLITSISVFRELLYRFKTGRTMIRNGDEIIVTVSSDGDGDCDFIAHFQRFG